MAEHQPPHSVVPTLVVLDVNIVLDVADLVGEPFSWERFDAVLAEHVDTTVPTPTDARIDSLKAIACLRQGRLPDGTPVEIWTSNHIDLLVAFKATQARDAPDPRDRGLGWSAAGAQRLIDDLIGDLVYPSGGDSVGDVAISYGTPPLDHEDGCVYATVNNAGHDGLYYDRFCLTRDKGFRAASLPGLIDVLHPSEWVVRHQAISRAIAFKRMLGGCGLSQRLRTSPWQLAQVDSCIRKGPSSPTGRRHSAGSRRTCS